MSNICKSLILVLVLLMPAIRVFADGINSMTLWMSSGKQITCMLDEQPVVTFEGDELVLTTHMDIVRYQAEDVIRFTYTAVDPAGINDASTAATSFSFDGDVMRASSLAPKSMVTVYTADGTLVASGKTDKSGNISLSLPRQVGVVYVVKTSVANFKITKP